MNALRGLFGRDRELAPAARVYAPKGTRPQHPIAGDVTVRNSDILALFLLSTLLSYFALRTPSGGASLERYADLLLLAGLVLLVACGFMLAWELGTFPVTAP